MKRVRVTSYHANGSVYMVNYAVSREPCGPDYLPDHWSIWLDNGKCVTSSAANHDLFYPGWRELPLKHL